MLVIMLGGYFCQKMSEKGKLPAWKVRDCGSHSGLHVSKKQNVSFFPLSVVKIQYCGEPP